VAKVNCATCHQGANKPLLGQKMVEDYVAALRP
jgi:photosynthetic reaction center cytochrome c subunit